MSQKVWVYLGKDEQDPNLLFVFEGKDNFKSGFYFYLIPKLKISSTIGKMKHLYHLGPVPNWFRYKICFTNMRHE